MPSFGQERTTTQQQAAAPVAKQEGLPVATFISPELDQNLPQAMEVVVVDAAELTRRAMLAKPPGAPHKPISYFRVFALIFAILLLLGLGGFCIYRFAIFPSTQTGAAGDASNAGGTFAPYSRSSSDDVYGIALVYSPTPVPTMIRDVFDEARHKWQSVLVEPGVSPRPPAGSMLCNHPERTYDGVERVDDLEIWVHISPIDGRGNVLGYSRPCGMVVSGTYRSVTGEMVFDMEDLEQMLEGGSLLGVITHEMGHVLGLGSFWENNRLVLPPDYIYTGAEGKLGYEDVGGTQGASPPIELDGGSGTAYSHWDEQHFGNELMTGYIGAGSAPLSRLTVRALRDLGYTVNLTNADAYMKPAQRPGGANYLRGSEDVHQRPRRHSEQDEALLKSLEPFPLVAV